MKKALWVAVPVVLGLTVAASFLTGFPGDLFTGSSSSSSSSSTPVQLAAGTGWSVEAFRGGDDQLCFQVPAGAGECTGWDAATTHDHESDTYLTSDGPSHSRIVAGPLRAEVALVRATAPGRIPVTIEARRLPSGLGAAKFFVMVFPDAGVDWTLTAQNTAGTAESLGL